MDISNLANHVDSTVVAKTIIIVIIIAIVIATVLYMLYTALTAGAVEDNTPPNDPSLTEYYIFTRVPNERNLIYLESTKAVYVIQHISTRHNHTKDAVVPFTPAYGYGGTHVYFLPDKNKLVNENGIEVPGIVRKVSGRP